MNEVTNIGFALLAVLATYQIYVSVVIFRPEEYERTQQLLQLLLVWIFPLFGALGCHLVLLGQRGTARRRESFFVPQQPNDAGGGGHYGAGDSH